MKSNDYINNPLDVIEECNTPQSKIILYNDKLLEWIANHILGSILFFDMALIIPLLVIPLSDEIKAIVFLISGSWIQLWALFALQHTQKKADEVRNTKADTDHIALTHIANQVDEILKRS